MMEEIDLAIRQQALSGLTPLPIGDGDDEDDYDASDDEE
jgi:hypothetical protein